MPLIQVTSTQSLINKKDQSTLMSRLSNAVLDAERAPITDAGAQSLVWAYYDEQPQTNVYVGGENLDKPPLRIAVTTPEGALTTASRQSLVEDIGRIVDDIVGPYDDRLNHWVMLYDLTEGNWAGGGQIFPLAGIQAAMNIAPAQ